MNNNQTGAAICTSDQVLTIQNWMVSGMPDFEMVQQAMVQWGINCATAREYLRQAYRNWQTDHQIELETRRNAKIAELQQLKYSMKAEYAGTPNGIRAVLAIEKEIMRLSGLEIHRVDLTTNGEAIPYAPIWGTIDPVLDDEDTADNGSEED